MASLFTCFCIGKRGKKITIKSKDIDGGSGTTKDSPSKLKPIRAQVATFDVGRQPFKVKHYKDSLETDGVKHGGGKDSASDDDVKYKCPSVKESSPVYLSATVGSANVGEGNGTKNDWFKIQTFDLRGNGGGGGGGVGGSSGNGGVTGGQQG